MKQMILELDVPPRATLDDFVVGANGAALQRLRRIATAGAVPEVPTCVWGPAGVGKTHLLRAVGAELVQRGKVVAWLDRGSSGAPYDDAWDAVLMDDVHAYGAALQQVAFNWFVNALAPRDGRVRTIVAASALPPADLALRDDLRTRLGWGHVFELQPLADEGRVVALERLARSRGITLPGEVSRYLLTHFSRDLTHLAGLLERMDRYALAARREVTVPLLKSMLEDEAREPSARATRSAAC